MGKGKVGAEAKEEKEEKEREWGACCIGDVEKRGRLG
jgi:hypothetical protein